MVEARSKRENVGPLAVRPLLWIAVSAAVPSLLTGAGLLVLILPIALDRSSVVQIALGSALSAYFALMVAAVLFTRLLITTSGLSWSDPFGHGFLRWTEISDIRCVELSYIIFWLARPPSRYFSLEITDREGKRYDTIATGLLTQRRRLLVAQQLRSKSREYDIHSDLTGLGETLPSVRAPDETLHTLHYRFALYRGVLRSIHSWSRRRDRIV